MWQEASSKAVVLMKGDVKYKGDMNLGKYYYSKSDIAANKTVKGYSAVPGINENKC